MATDLTKYFRDSSQDLVWNSSTNHYESDSTPAASGYLIDGSGNILLFNGKAIYINVETSYNLTFSISGSSVPAPTVTVTNGNNTISVSNGDVITVYGECTINAVSNENKYIHIKKDGTHVTGGYTSQSYTFIPDSDCSMNIYTDDR